MKAAAPMNVSEAVILMAGSGSRLNRNTAAGSAKLKPLTPLLGRPLITYVFEALAQFGIKRVHAVVGFEAARMREAVRVLAPAAIDLKFIHNPEWQKQNGLSLLAAARLVDAPFILTMADHIFDPSIVDLLMRKATPDYLSLAIDKKVSSIYDLPDAMKVRTAGDGLAALGKDLTLYDAIDTGLFLWPRNTIERVKDFNDGGDYSLADIVRGMAASDRVRLIDIGDRWWQDVDTPQMLAHAEKDLAARLSPPPSREQSRENGIALQSLD